MASTPVPVTGDGKGGINDAVLGNVQAVYVIGDRGANSFAVKIFSVTTAGGGIQIVPANNVRRTITFVNMDASVTIYLGNTGVVATGVANDAAFPLKPSQSISVDTTAAVFGKVASGSALIGYWETFE